MITQSPPASPIPIYQAGPSPRAKAQFLLGVTIDNLFRRFPVDRVLFVTMTFSKPTHSTVYAQKRLNSFFNKLRRRCPDYIWTLEAQSSGSIHYHLLVPVPFDCHSGTDLYAWSQHALETPAQKRASMNPALRAESDWWQTTAPCFGFGIVQVEPIYSNAEAVRKYLTKQDARLLSWPFEEKKRVRFWNCSKSLKSGSVKFSWNTPGGKACRDRMAAWAAERGCDSRDELRRRLGPQWGYKFHCEMIKRRHSSNNSSIDA